MPHIIIEHSESARELLEASNTPRHVHQIVVDSGIFSVDAIKTRTVSYETIYWGKEAQPIEFVHITVKILKGRTEEQRKALSQAIFDQLAILLPSIPKRSVDIHEMDKATYMKTS